ncbi:MAG: FimB/Mfa2 family fimbrial subunit [Muribaculaceae bacterium]|nr:FimB/Mfa2 family fimbrial subunit [Muribaculaceae bacterium]
MIKSRLIILLSAVMALVASCTYDYFLDNASYQVFIPQVEGGEVGDALVLIYDDEGNLVGMKHWTPGSDPRMDKGLFAFDLPPGHYKTYIYVDVDSSFDFNDVETLKPDPNRPGIPGLPGTPIVAGSSITVKTPDGQPSGSTPVLPNGDPKTAIQEITIPPYGPIQTDTCNLMTIPGRITVQFYRLETPVDLIAKAEVIITGVGNRWYLGGDHPVTDPGSYVYTIYNPIVRDESGKYLMIFDDYLFPSIPGETITYTFKFYDADGNLLRERLVQVLDDNRLPYTLNPGDHIIIEVGDQGYTIIVKPWESDINGGGNTGAGVL